MNAEDASLAGLRSIGLLIRNPPTVEEAPSNSIRYIHLPLSGITPMLQGRLDQAMLSFTLDLPGVVGARQVLHTSTADLLFWMRLIAAHKLASAELPVLG